MNDPNNPYTVDQFKYIDQSDRYAPWERKGRPRGADADRSAK